MSVSCGNFLILLVCYDDQSYIPKSLDAVKNPEADVAKIMSGQDTGDMLYQTITGLKDALPKVDEQQIQVDVEEEKEEEENEEEEEESESEEEMGPEDKKAARKENKKKVKEEKREGRKNKTPKSVKKRKKKVSKPHKTR